jgi:hypothetical protein
MQKAMQPELEVSVQMRQSSLPSMVRPTRDGRNSPRTSPERLESKVFINFV